MHFIADFWGFWEEYPERAHRVGYGASLLVVLTIIAGFFIVGTPMQARQALEDSQKVSDLQNIQSQIVYYWQQKGVLPATLANLNDSLTNYSVPTDEQTGQPYGYNTQGVHSFQLCATFNRDSTDQPQSVPSVPSMPPTYPGGTGTSIGNSWQHGPGNVCFLRTIDPQMYPVNKNTATQ